jgi:hypothetical protein
MRRWFEVKRLKFHGKPPGDLGCESGRERRPDKPKDIKTIDCIQSALESRPAIPAIRPVSTDFFGLLPGRMAAATGRIRV